MRALSLITLVTLLLGFCSCKKEVIEPTQAQLNQQELMQVIKKNGIDRVVIVGFNQRFPDYFSSSEGMSFTFSNGFISIHGYEQSFNLAYLMAYNIENIRIRDNNGNFSSDQALVLYLQF